MMRACAEASRPSAYAPWCRSTPSWSTAPACADRAASRWRQGEVRLRRRPDFDATRSTSTTSLMARQRRFRQQERAGQRRRPPTSAAWKTPADRARASAPTRSTRRSNIPKQVAMPERDAQQRASCFDEVNLGYAQVDARCARPNAASSASKPTCIDGCRCDRHPALHPPPDGARPARSAVGDPRIESSFRRSAGASARRESQCEAQCVLIKAKMEPVASAGSSASSAITRRPRSPRARSGLELVAGPPWRSSARAPAASGGGADLAAAARSRCSRRCTWWAACCATASLVPAAARRVIERELQQLRDAGVKFQTNKVIGKTFGIQQLMERMGFDAVFIAAGAGAPLFLGMPGESGGRCSRPTSSSRAST